ncbi:MAG: lipoate-protein ligase A [Nitrospinales bacterium]|jgi:lipoate-protein ligase A
MDQYSWRIIQDSLGDGALNMITDRAILMACNEGKVPATLRLYGWQRPTLSIGYSQEISQYIDLESCERNNIPVVRRFTGGRALLHQYEMTYSVIAPIPHPAFPGSLRGSFERISQAILESLRIGGVEGATVAGKNNIRDVSGRSPACFSMANHCEIVVRGKKLVGSAQRRLRSAFLQHGSIILDMAPNLTHTLLKYSSETQKQAVLDSLISNTTSLKQLLQRNLKNDEVNQWFLKGFQKTFPGKWEIGKLTQQESELIKDFQII